MSPARNPQSQGFDLDGAQSATQSTVATPRSSAKRRIGIYVPIAEDGTLDTSRVRDAGALEQARAALLIKDATPAVERKPLDINPKMILVGYSLLEVIIQKAGKYLLKWPDDLTQEMHFDAEKKQALVDPTIGVINKYSDKLTWLVENQEVAALTMALTDAVDDMVEQGVQRYTMKVAAKNQEAQMQTPVPAQAVNGHAAVTN